MGNDQSSRAVPETGVVEELRYSLHDQGDDAIDTRYSIFEGDEIVLLFNLPLAGHLRARDVVDAFNRANALEAKDRELAEVLADPIVVHRNMLRGTIAKPSMNNIAHLYPEVQQMKEALLSTLKHFRWPTSSERETRDKVLAALAHFDEPPSSVLSSVQPVSGSREQRGNEEG